MEHRCETCAAWCRDPAPRRAVDDRRDRIPPGHRVAFHLCRDCVRRLHARRSDLWGWIYRVPV